MKQQKVSEKKQNIQQKPSQPSVKSKASDWTPENPYLQLDGIVGNHGVLSRFGSDVIQAKLTLGSQNDRYEQEADRVADSAIRILSHRLLEPAGRTGSLRHSSVQTKEFPNHIPKAIANLQTHTRAVLGGGRPLPKSVRIFFEQRFGYDFTNVRLHSNTHAAKTAKALDARAFTVAHNIFFDTGAYSPGTKAGQRLLAHELVHVVQQGACDRVEHVGLLRPTIVAATLQRYCEAGTSRTSQECCPNLDDVIFDWARELWAEGLVDIYPQASFVDLRIWSRPSQRGFLDEDIHFRNPGGPVQHIKIVVHISWTSDDPLQGVFDGENVIATIVADLYDFSGSERIRIGLWIAQIERSNSTCRVTGTSDVLEQLEQQERLRRRQQRRPRQRFREGAEIAS